jgi:chitin synthase
LAKFANKKKLSSHLWFFEGFCNYLKPKYTILLDCGLNPDKEALFNLFLAMENDPNIGGVCGFMGLKPEMIADSLGQR